ncbi:MAG: hypothetical protein J0J01_13365 [Reyranella sp.]|uniref:hypothetical protein n=1 Tax=Reyranella sp. TaxID=1929291 RepID=UPI001AC36B8B|nr:hypothetical protein [Reyranella sp.]MBN9087894.1 hypothetical protein [Reyranella sp.]
MTAEIGESSCITQLGNVALAMIERGGGRPSRSHSFDVDPDHLAVGAVDHGRTP